jgi:hypothetical protein
MREDARQKDGSKSERGSCSNSTNLWTLMSMSVGKDWCVPGSFLRSWPSFGLLSAKAYDLSYSRDVRCSEHELKSLPAHERIQEAHSPLPRSSFSSWMTKARPTTELGPLRGIWVSVMSMVATPAKRSSKR